MSTVRHSPQFDCLEGRTLLSATKVTRAFLLTPVAEGTTLAEHIHPHLSIVINGQAQTIPAGVGIQPNGALPIHTHAPDGTLHVESPQQMPFKLRDFFTIWGQPFSKKTILGHTARRGEKITMTVDGRPSQQFGNLLLQDGQEIVIRYGR
ncbi:hypothetical protein SAMN05444166_2728 [Singulisphaera sp. GP187]|uniref:hypothetical protein n=1 Tax=Singulisphaera sp. GP187 TaxID=1882752 RepID=UPI000926CFBC|nr:hypothetical protein [Singulisphaera sp. GP187]SIO15349.1 hypothetical protein SAMN05444166_2728 [Singulisphaera sp. GP187]